MNRPGPQQTQTENKWEFLLPTQVKSTDSTGKTIVSYSFPIIKAPAYSEVITSNLIELSHSLFTPAIINSYLLELYNAFLRVHSHRFAKNYTPAQLIKVSDYKFNTTHVTGSEDEEYNFTLTPAKIDITGNRFIINWNVIAESVKIQLIEESDEEKLEEVDVTGLVSESVETKGDFLRRNSSKTNPQSAEAKKQLEHAQLRVRIAKLKAERAIEKYVMRYGPIDPALLDSDSDNDNS
jgi:hypothetical protein